MKLRIPNRFLSTVTLSLSVAAVSSQSACADATWVGSSSQDWNTAANWSSSPANPTGSFLINNATPGVLPIISANSAFSPADIKIGSGATGRLDHTAGTAAAGAGNWFFVGANSGTGTYNVANTAVAGGGISGFAQGSGSLSAAVFWVGGADYNDNGTGTVNINTSGTIATTGSSNGGGMILAGAWNGGTANATVNMEAGTINVSAETWVGRSGTGVWNQSGGTLNGSTYLVIGRETPGAGQYTAGNGTVNLSGGTINAATTAANSFPTIASFSGSSGLLNVSGGTFVAGSGTNLAPLYVGEGGTGTLTTSGSGLVSIANTTEGLRLGRYASATGTVNLNGGTIQTPIVTRGAGYGAFNFNGGTLKAAQSTASFMTGLSAVSVNAGGAVIDSNGFDIAIGQDLTDGGGGLTKNGAGTLTLSGADVYTGATAVNAGTLAFTSKQSFIGSVSVANAAAGLRVQAFDTSSTPLASTGLTLVSGSSLTFDFNSFNVGATTPLISTGGLTAGGPVAVTILNAGNLSSGPHKLIGYTSFGSGSFTGSPFSLGTRSSGTLTNGSGALTLNVSSDSPKWTGLDSGNWVVGTTGANKNWKLISAGTATDYIQGDVVAFDDSVTTGTTSVNISTANVSPASTTFSNSSKSYTLGSAGAFGIAGTGPLTKTGTGSLIITNANTYTGVTTIDAGATLTLGDGATGHDGTIAGTSGVANEGTLAYNRFGSSTAGYLISGSGSVSKSGSGTQILSAANTYAGGTTVTAGTLQTTTTAGAANTGAFNLGGGTFQVNLGAGADFNYAPTINLNAASTFGNGAAGAIANTQGQINFTGTINGNNNALNIANTGLARFYLNGLVFDVPQINVLSGAMGFDINNFNDRGTAAVDIASGAALWTAGNNNNPVINNLTFHGGDGIGAKGALFFEGGNATPAPFTGTVFLSAGTTAVGSAYVGDTITLNGVVSGAGAFNVITGTALALGGANTYSGGTTITLGIVKANGNTALGTGAVSTAAVPGVQLQLASGVTIGNTLTMNGSSFTGQGVLYVPTGDAIYSGPINITASPTAGGHLASGTGTLNVTGAITSSVPVVVRNGIVVFTNTGSSYSGLNVQQGTLKLGATNVIPVANTVDVGASGAAILDLGGFNQTLAGITKNANGATVTNSSIASDSILTTTGTSTFGGVIQNGAVRKTALNVASGALTLSGLNTFTGNITVSGGLNLADNAQLKFTPGPNTLVNSIGGNGTVTLDGDFVIDTAGATIANGNTWTLVNVGTLTENFSATFSVVDFTESANVWTKVDGANTWTFSEATGVLSLAVSGGSPYSTWATSKGLTNANNGTIQDPNNNGIANLLEYVLNGDPSNSESPASILPTLNVSGTNFVFSFTQRVDSTTDTVQTFQYGSTLAGWTDVAISPTPGTGVVTGTPTGTAPNQVQTVTVTVPKGSNTALFGRLRAVK
ncbi:MAG: autotransporter-associated beta strand repeat-containing protein [Luteolibacter sp.]